jgi:hypothetical protein
MKSAITQITFTASRARAGIGALTLLLASALAGCGGGSVTETVKPVQEPASFNLQATARALFTERARYEARMVGTSTPSGRMLLDIQPSTELVALGADGKILEPRSVTWNTALYRDGVAASVRAFDATFKLSFTSAVVGSSYDIRTGLISFHQGAIDGYSLVANNFQYLRPVSIGGWLGEHSAWLAMEVKLLDASGSGALAAMALYNVRLTPVASAGSPNQAWFCVDKSYYEPNSYLRQAYETQSYCWLIGRDGRPLGAFKASVARPGEELKFEGGRL